MENTSSFAQFARLVPTTYEKVCGRIEDTFAKPDEESNADDLIAGRGSGERESENGPHELTAGYPDRWTDLGEYELRRKLPYDIASSPGNINHVELVCVHSQVFLHPRYICIGYVGLVKIFDEVAEAQNGQEACVQLLNENPLLMRP